MNQPANASGPTVTSTVVSTASVKISMTETVHYDVEVPLDEFAEIIGVEATVEAVTAAIDNDYDADYGVGDCDALLDLAMENFTSVSERTWDISVAWTEPVASETAKVGA